MNLFKERSRAVLVSVNEYLDYAETMRESDMANMANITQSTLTNALCKLEEALYDTSTRHCKQMAPVYSMFEQKILETLVAVNAECFLSFFLILWLTENWSSLIFPLQRGHY